MKDSCAEQLGGIDADTDSAEQPVNLLLIAYVQLLRCAARHFLENFLCCENEPDADADSVNALSNACSLIMSSFLQLKNLTRSSPYSLRCFTLQRSLGKCPEKERLRASPKKALPKLRHAGSWAAAQRDPRSQIIPPRRRFQR